MISFVEPLAAGNAIRLHLAPPPGAVEWRVLRRPGAALDADFAGPDDPGAARVGDPDDPRPGSVLDTAGLQNGLQVAYRPYHRDPATGWIAGKVRRATPLAAFLGDGPDVQALVRERVALGLQAEIQRGTLRPASGRISVVTAPFGAPDEKALPIVSVHLDSDAPAHRFIGEQMVAELRTAASGGIGSGVDESEGYLSRVALNVVAVSANGDERAALRRALKRVFIANLPVWDDAGLMLPEFAQRDDEQPGQNNAVLYRAEGALSCVAPAVVHWPASIVRDVTVSADCIEPFEDTP